VAIGREMPIGNQNNCQVDRSEDIPQTLNQKALFAVGIFGRRNGTVNAFT
jgi:hypothetical protein